MATLQPRYYDDCWYEDGNRYCRNSAWDNWVRWVVLVVVVLGFFLLFVFCSCLTARRRRRAGRQPFYGTGWAARPGQGGYNYNNQQNAQPYYSQPAPPYSPQQPQNSYYGQNQGYFAGAQQPQPYGQQQQGVELQSPQPAHAHTPAGGNVYAPPMGPPPAKM